MAAHDVDVNGDAKQRLDGHFLGETAFDVGPGDLLVPITFFSGGSPLPVTLGDTHLYGDLQAEGGDGVLVGGLPLDALIDKVVAPLVPDNYDINGDGVPETKAEIMELIWSIAPLSADIQLSDGTNTISARFIWTASPATWVVT